MTEYIIRGIAQALAVFGYKVYEDTVEQDLEIPCFVIDEVAAIRLKRLNKRYKLTISISISFLSDTAENARFMAERLPWAIEDISCKAPDGKLWKFHSKSPECNIDDQHTMHCLVDYTTEVAFEVAKQLMTKINLTTEVTNG